MTSELDQLAALLTAEDWHELLDDDSGFDVDGFVFVSTERGQRHRSYTQRTVITRGPSGQHYQWAYGDVHHPDHDDLPPSVIGSTPTAVYPVDEVKTETVRKWVTTEPPQRLAAASPVPNPSESDSNPATDSAAARNRGHSSTVTPGDARRQLLSPFDWPTGLTDQQARAAGEHATAFLGDVLDLLDLADTHDLDPGDQGEREALRILGAVVASAAQAIGWRAPTWSTPPVSQIEAIAYAWMRHLGHSDEQIRAADTQSCTDTCERAGDAWDCIGEDGRSRHPIADDFNAAIAMAHVTLDALTEYATLADEHREANARALAEAAPEQVGHIPAGMTLARIEILLADIRDYAETGDPEAAHARENHLHTETLKAIANHAPDPAALAAAALRSGQVEFPRPCA